MIVNYELMPDDDLEQGGGLLGRKDNDTLVCYDGYDLCHGKILAGWNKPPRRSLPEAMTSSRIITAKAA